VCHDIGKIQIPHEILYKPGKLTNEEFAEVKKHTVYGYEILNNSNVPEEVAYSALMHHEKMDGSGYPLGRSHDSIGLYAAVVAICDVYEAMTSDRIYRARVSPFEVIRKLEQDEFGALRNEYIYMFIRKIAETFSNNNVLLSDEREGRIILINKNHLAYPLVYCEQTKEFIDLSKNKDISIINVI
jgi:HD-GYP domain-containing protein (c-di-GMP phosphodiesterase class II)